MNYYNAESADALAELKSGRHGLTEAEAQARLAQNGKNKLVEGKKKTPPGWSPDGAFSVVSEPAYAAGLVLSCGATAVSLQPSPIFSASAHG